MKSTRTPSSARAFLPSLSAGLRALAVAPAAVLLLSGCEPSEDARSASAPPPGLACDPDDGGLELPAGFCALVVADSVGEARHLTVAPNGDIYVAAYEGNGARGGVVALRDTTGDGKADVRLELGPEGGTGIALHGEWVYFAPDDRVLRIRRPQAQLQPAVDWETVVSGLPDYDSHNAKAIALDDAGNLYVNIGAPSNSCQVEDRAAGSPGQDPCPQLETRAGVWRFDATATGQTQEDGSRFATGTRNLVALTWNPGDGHLYGVQHGRDQLSQNWSDVYTVEQGAELPAEEMFRIQEGDDFGWPYCYYDHQDGAKVLAPEYGGDGEAVGRCASTEDPVVAFPGHWGPNAILFYGENQFPGRYHGGAFIAFHGSWNRAPLPQQGYKVVFVPFRDGEPTGGYEDFATGFVPGEKTPRSDNRPSGLATGPDGSLYVSEDSGGTIWRIVYLGEE